jgi:hypothetical protein
MLFNNRLVTCLSLSFMKLSPKPMVRIYHTNRREISEDIAVDKRRRREKAVVN